MMHLFVPLLMLVLMLTSCATLIGALEAWRVSDLRAFKVTLACGVPLSLLTIGLFLMVGPPDPFARSDHFGFGPDWHCLWSSARSSFCMRDVAHAAPVRH